MRLHLKPQEDIEVAWVSKEELQKDAEILVLTSGEIDILTT